MSAVPNTSVQVDSLLEGLLAEAKAAEAAVAPVAAAAGEAEGSPAWPGGVGGAKPVVQKLTYSHQAMIDLILANPGISQNAIAERFGYTPSWISQVMSSDAFQAAFAARRAEIVDPALALTVEQNFKALVARSLDILQQKLNRPANEIPDQLALRAFEIGARVAGYGHSDAPPVTARQEVHVHLEQLGSGLVALLQRKKTEVQALPAAVSDGDDSNSLPSLGDFTDESQNT